MKAGDKRKTLALAGICIFVTALIAFLSANRFIWLEAAEKGAVNFLYNQGRFAEMNTNIVFIGIDKSTYKEEFHEQENENPETAWNDDPVAVAVRGSFPWNRSVWASVCDKLIDEGAATILIDIVFASISKELLHDQAFREVIQKHGDKIVIGWTLQNADAGLKGEKNFTLQMPAETIIDPDPVSWSTIESANTACVAIFPEEDGTVRRAHYTITTREVMDMYLPSAEELAQMTADEVGTDYPTDDLSPAVGNTNLSAEDMALLLEVQQAAAPTGGGVDPPGTPTDGRPVTNGGVIAVEGSALDTNDAALLALLDQPFSGEPTAEGGQHPMTDEQASMNQLEEVVALDDEDTFYDFLATKAARLLGLEAHIPPHSVHPLFRYAGPPGTFAQLPLWHIVHPRMWQDNFKGKGTLAGKVVVIGPTANIFQDKHNTPFTYKDAVMLGPEIHLNMLNALLQNEFLKEASTGTNQLIIWLSGLFSLLITIILKRPYLRVFISAGICLGYLRSVLYAYNQHDTFIIAVAPVLVVMTSTGLAMVVELVVEQLARLKLTMTMNKYFSPAVMKEVLDNPGSLDSRSADVTLLLTDLRNSTPLAEKLGPKGMFKLLNQIFEAQTDSIMDQNGNLEHFLGDQFLSYWGAPQDQPDGPNQALIAARDLIGRMEKVKEIQEPHVKAIFGYGVALHAGFALVGNKGSEKKMEYGLVGDTINEAARIEALTKYYQAQLLVSEAVFERLSDPGVHRMVDRVIVKGKTEPVVLYELEQVKSPANFKEITEVFSSGFVEYSHGKFEEARSKFQKLIDEFDDGPSKVMVDRCEQLIADPRPDWKGVWKMESK